MNIVKGLSKKGFDTKAQRQRCKRVTRKIEHALGLHKWLAVEILYNERPEERTLCECMPDWEYLQCKFDWNISYAAMQSDEQLEEAAIHEFAHALIAPITTKKGKREELAVENLARAMWTLWKKGKK